MDDLISVVMQNYVIFAILYNKYLKKTQKTIIKTLKKQRENICIPIASY